jgi:hypothetical protein
MASETIPAGRTALLLLGCPQVPVQTSLALYLTSRLRKKGITPVIAGNRAARVQVEISDPDRHYVGEVIDLDRAVAELSENQRRIDLCFAFIHNDAGVSYAATVQSITGAPVVAFVYGEHLDEVLASITFPCEKVAAKAVHNPMPMKQKMDEVLPWAVSNL